MADLTTDVRYIKGIGEKKAQALNKLGVFTLYDLVSYFPRKYEDRSQYKPIALAADGETVCIQAMVADTPRLTRIRRGLDLVKLRIVDDSGVADVTYFNQPYTKDNLHRGETYVFFGKIEVKGTRRSMTNPVYEKEGTENGVTGRIVPIYRLSAGLNQRLLLQAVRQGLNTCGDQLPELLPETVRERCHLVQARYAYENIHFPVDFGALELARRRLIFEELFVLACALGKMRGTRVRENGIPLRDTDLNDFWRSLPFAPTGAQQRAVEQALADMSSGAVMNRLVQGDVGSGKTLVAAALIWAAWKNGLSSAFMAPTEILAEQHYTTLREMLSPFGLRVGKLTGSMTAKEKREAKAALREGAIDLVIGTHALFSDDVEYASLGLVVTDEQHRFGVEQRSALIGKGGKPHVLVMSATPIPRTLALIIYGDLDVSIIDELPPGRQKVDTFTVDESYRDRLNGFIRKLCAEGRQVFVVCPMVDENEDLPMPLRSAEEHARDLASTFPELRIACVHGKMKARDKDAVMAAFLAGETDVLVSTTVIEVGVDVPNAALMIVENAERFGLSQLHQLRGRVGRGAHKSYCILVSDADNEDVRARLRIMCQTNDGFKISEEDLRLRGPGDFFGSRQHGLPETHIADLGADTEILQRAQQEANALLASDPDLASPENTQLRDRVEQLFRRRTDSFN
ncbi:MAG: ATP-dependent DNA helicase RecG [Oscillospiraceae bacterium]|nr:ATP-dependent DNA helicase RecG [Oscillospiraceae bacterium]